MRFTLPAASLIALVAEVVANTEKVIFTAPSAITIPNIRPGLDDLSLDVLSPAGLRTLETNLAVQFPSDTAPRGVQSWYLLKGLEAGRRYEVRACWPATQPTEFWLDVHNLTHVFETPLLISSLADYSEQRQHPGLQAPRHAEPEATSQSVLLLQVHSAADYFTSNRTLMEHPPAVDVDIILDPFLLNILPQSLGPTALYITVLTAGSFFLSGAIYNWLYRIAEIPKPHTD
ncbi:uncharacterized protein BDZ99DRAFT_278028 [Mytilinidion resinicola]|uniref:Uncharacterized protein n=1 Tax=Mytilinidion resinicola TaxID=574789 RepID=A0A6A6YTC1_9PEZI|nr:uncharacterized protein BDZ99DRAFT_278028 [Mytilinidion resinicola]KAF2811613.1 hypothetical protein BDZ99DRAFT_278028 [Mytilinidion resinicola]